LEDDVALRVCDEMEWDDLRPWRCWEIETLEVLAQVRVSTPWLAVALGLSLGGAQWRVSRLIQQGLVERLGENGATRPLALTPLGEAVIRNVPFPEEVQHITVVAGRAIFDYSD
jgi:hypothetical protein